jgi:predicted dehydrogenase
MTPDVPWRVGIIGLGRAVSGANQSGEQAIWTHPAAIAAHPMLEIAGCLDPDARVAEAFSLTWATPAARDWNELIAQRLDCLLIAAPTDVHERYLADALTAQIPVIVCEKPLTADRKSAGELIAAYRAAQRRLHVYYPRRSISELNTLRQRILKKEFGPLRSFSAYYGNGLRNIGCHVIELILRLFGPVKQVEARAFDADHVSNRDPSPSLWLRLESGVEGIMQAYQYSDYAMLELDMLFQDARVRLSDLGFRLEFWCAGSSGRYLGFRELALERVGHTDYGDATRRFWDTVRDSAMPIIDDWELDILDVVEAGLKSLQSGRAVDVGSGD